MNKSSFYSRLQQWFWLALMLVLSSCQSGATPVSPTLQSGATSGAPQATLSLTPAFETLIPGHSTEADVIQEMGTPLFTRQTGPYTVYVYRPHKWDEHYFVFQAEGLQLIQRQTLESKLADILQQYGLPEKITWAASGYEFTRLFVYAQQGYAVIADNGRIPTEADVVEKWYFSPMQADAFMAAFGPYFIPTSAGNDHDTNPEDYWPYWDWLNLPTSSPTP